MPGQREMDILIRAQDEASEVMQQIGDEGEEAASLLESSWLKVGAALGVAGYGLDRLARQTSQMLRSLRITADVTAINTSELQSLAVGLANVTFGMNDVVFSLEALMQRGVRNKEMLAGLAIEFDKVADATGNDIVPLIETATELFSAFGGGIYSVVEHGDAMTHILNTTSLELSHFNRLSTRGRRELDAMNLTMDEGLAVLMALEAKYQSGRAATREFGRQARRAQGDKEQFYQLLELTTDQLDHYSEQLEKSTGISERHAEIDHRQYTIMQKLSTIMEKLQFQYAHVFELLSALTPLLIGAVPAIWLMKQAFLATKGAILLVKPIIAALTTKMVALKVATIGLPAAFIAAGVGLGWLLYKASGAKADVDMLTDAIEEQEERIKEFEQELKRLEEGGEVRGLTVRELEASIKAMRENIAKNIEDRKKLMEQGEEEQVGIIERMWEKTSSIFADSLLNITQKLSEGIHGWLDGLDDWLFDSNAIYEEFGELTADMLDDFLDKFEDFEVGIGQSTEEIWESHHRQILAVEEIARAYRAAGDSYDENTEKVNIYADTVRKLIQAGLTPANDELDVMMIRLSRMAWELENTDEGTKILANTLRFLIEEGFDPADPSLQNFAVGLNLTRQEAIRTIKPSERIAEVMKDLKENIEAAKDRNEMMGDSFDLTAEKTRLYENALVQLIPDMIYAGAEIEDIHEKLTELERVEVEETIDKITEEIKNAEHWAEMLENELSFLGESVDVNQEKLQIYQSWLSQLTDDYEKNAAAIAWVIIQMKQLEIETSPVNQILSELSLEMEKTRVVSAHLGDETRLYRNQLRLAERAIDALLTEQIRQGQLTEEQQRELEEWTRKWEEAGEILKVVTEDIDRGNQSLAETYRRLLNIEDLAEIFEWEELEENERKLRDIEGIIQRMVNEGRDVIQINEEESITLDELRDKREEIIELIEEATQAQENWATRGFGAIRRHLPILDKALDIVDRFTERDLDDVIFDLGVNISTSIADFLGVDLSGKLGAILGPVGGIIMMLLGESDQFKEIMEKLNPVLQASANIVGDLLTPIMPLIDVLTWLTPVFDATGTLIALTLEPAFRALFPVIKWVTLALQGFMWAIMQIRRGFFTIMAALARGIDRIPFVSATNAINYFENALKTTEDSIEDLEESMRELKDMTYDTTKAKEDEKEAIEDANEELLNVPQGYRVALRRFQATFDREEREQRRTQQQAAFTQQTTTQQTTNVHPGAIQVTIVSDDPEEIWRQLKPVMQTENFQKNGTIIQPAPQYA